MEYTVQKLARLAGISPRALRHYDQIGLLVPRRVASSGYRIYGAQEVERLQQILLYRRLGVPLDAIRALLDAPAFDAEVALHAHLEALMLRRQELDVLIANVTRTISHGRGEVTMQDDERFAGLGERMVAENEEKYGQEIRARYGEEAVEGANRHVRGMTQRDFAVAQEREEAVRRALSIAMDTGDPAGPEAHRAAALHYEWLQGWGSYTPEMHIGLGQMYVEDARFSAYYDAIRPGAAIFLRDAIARYHADKQG